MNKTEQANCVDPDAIIDEDGDGIPDEPEEEVESSRFARSLFHKYPISPEKVNSKRPQNNLGGFTDSLWGSKAAKEKYFSH